MCINFLDSYSSDNLELNVYGNIDASMLVSGVRIDFLVS